MSSAQSLEDKLEALQCHFTWDLNPSTPRLITLQEILEVVSTDEGNFWLGPIYNLQGFIHYKLGSTKEALRSFNQATETFQRQNGEGPWLMVNFGDLAWLHHLMGEDEKSQDYLSKVEALRRRYPAPPEEEKEKLHPEVCAEKAWTLMRFDSEKKLQAAELFQRAVQMQPDAVEWQSSYAILRGEAFKDNMKNMESEVFEMLRSAKERDPGNLYVAALYLEARAARGELVESEVQILSEKVLKAPVSSYSGISPLLRLYRNYRSKDEAVELAEKALRRHPDSRYIKRQVAICLVRKVLSPEYKPQDSEIRNVIRLWEKVKEDYDGNSSREDLTLADLYAKVDVEKADGIYRELLERNDLDLKEKQKEKQMLYHHYAKYLYFNRKESHGSILYHMKAAEIPVESQYREKSITELEKTLNRKRDQEMCKEIRELLDRVKNEPKTQNQ